MADYPFNPEVDKITEREVVYDFANRLCIGRDIKADTRSIRNTSGEDYYSDISLFHPPMEVQQILARLAMMNRESLALNIEDIWFVTMPMAAGEISKTISGKMGMTQAQAEHFYGDETDFKFMAISERTGMDISGAITANRGAVGSGGGVGNAVMRFTYIGDSAFLNDDIIKIYFWYNGTY